MYLTFNELSFGGCGDHTEANRAFDNLKQTVSLARLRGVSVAIRVRSDFWQQRLYGQVTFAEFINSRSKDDKAWLRRAVTGISYVDSYLSSLSEAFEFSCQGSSCTGLGVAFLENSLTVGLNPSEARRLVPLTVVRLQEPADITESSVEVGNLANGECVAFFDPQIRERILREFKNGQDVLEQRANALSSLEFCTDAERTIASLSGSEPVFAHVIHHLYLLNLTTATWTSGRFADALGVRCSEESNPTLQKYGRKFTCPDGTVRDFSWHTKIGPLSWRIHFIHDSQRKRVLIGYVGGHLPTVSDP